MAQMMPNQEYEIGIKESHGEVKAPKRYHVYLINDDYTPMDFVIQVLQEIFAFSAEKAFHTMMLIHHEGKGICGTYTLDIAMTKQAQVDEFSEQEEYPLQCVIEELT